MKLFASLALAIGVSAAPIWQHAASDGALQPDAALKARATAGSACQPPGGSFTQTGTPNGRSGASGEEQTSGSTFNYHGAVHFHPNGVSEETGGNACNPTGPANAGSGAGTSEQSGGQEAGSNAGSDAGITNPNAVNAQAHSQSTSTSHVIQTPDGPVVVSHSSSNSYAHDANGDSAQSGSESTAIKGEGGSYTEQGSHENSRGGATATAQATAIATTSATPTPTPTP